MKMSLRRRLSLFAAHGRSVAAAFRLRHWNRLKPWMKPEHHSAWWLLRNRSFWVHRLRLLLSVMLVAAVTTGCVRKVYIDRPAPFEVVRQVVEPVAPELTAHPTEMPEGPIRHAPLVAAQRKSLLEQAWAQLDAIRAKHGDASPPKPTE